MTTLLKIFCACVTQPSLTLNEPTQPNFTELLTGNIKSRERMGRFYQNLVWMFFHKKIFEILILTSSTC
jgi:hypothetical protein